MKQTRRGYAGLIRERTGLILEHRPKPLANLFASLCYVELRQGLSRVRSVFNEFAYRKCARCSEPSPSGLTAARALFDCGK